MAILTHQSEVPEESQPGGRLYADRWMLSSFTFADFFLAVMVLALDVAANRQKMPSSATDPQAQVKIGMLERSYHICFEKRTYSREARRVTDALGIMLSKLKPVSLEDQTLPFQPSTGGSFRDSPPSRNCPAPSETHASAGDILPDPIQGFIAGPESVDWAFLDQYLLDPIMFDSISPNWSGPALPGSVTP